MMLAIAIIILAVLLVGTSFKIVVDVLAAGLARQYADDVGLMQLCAADRRVVRYTPPRARKSTAKVPSEGPHRVKAGHR